MPLDIASRPDRATIPFIDAVNKCRSAVPTDGTARGASAGGTAGTPLKCAAIRPNAIVIVIITKIPRPTNTMRDDSPRPRIVRNHVTAAKAAPIKKCQIQVVLYAPNTESSWSLPDNADT